ncbi:hypothetical protein Athai_25630 [Actinocatenispora thailandica]|uniref:Uncharacterized protein n=1 Tax=Actinocatenispora thailandica TaxID=227318 RepID=A0A7R7DP48_9ACTN|nr:hypothetical protein Athai_25630 [Actinocatenispora thailandica]
MEALSTLVGGDDPPLRPLLGSIVYDLAVQVSQQRLAGWSVWEPVSRAAEQTIPAPRGARYQPRRRHSARCGRSAPSVVSSPWPG